MQQIFNKTLLFMPELAQEEHPNGGSADTIRVKSGPCDRLCLPPKKPQPYAPV